MRRLADLELSPWEAPRDIARQFLTREDERLVGGSEEEDNRPLILLLLEEDGVLHENVMDDGRVCLEVQADATPELAAARPTPSADVQEQAGRDGRKQPVWTS